MSTAAPAKTGDYTLATGRRKTAVARVRIKAGSGKITINGRTAEDYFPAEKDRFHVFDALNQTGKLATVDVTIAVKGGGPAGQAGACKLGIARAESVRHRAGRHAAALGAINPRRPHERAQEIRLAWRPAWHAVLQAIISKYSLTSRRIAVRRA